MNFFIKLSIYLLAFLAIRSTFYQVRAESLNSDETTTESKPLQMSVSLPPMSKPVKFVLPKTLELNKIQADRLLRKYKFNPKIKNLISRIQVLQNQVNSDQYMEEDVVYSGKFRF